MDRNEVIRALKGDIDRHRQRELTRRRQSRELWAWVRDEGRKEIAEKLLHDNDDEAALRESIARRRQKSGD